MDELDLAQLSWDLLLVAVVAFILSGSLFSMGVLRFSQQRSRQGSVYMALTVVSFAAFLIVINKYYL